MTKFALKAQKPTKITLTTNETSRNDSSTGRTGATAPALDLVCNKTQTLNIVETQHTNTATGKFDPHTTNKSSCMSQRILESK